MTLLADHDWGLASYDLASHALRGVAGVQRDDPFNVRVMPKITFGAHPLGYDGLAADDPGIVVLHHFLGSWKMRSVGWRKNRENLASLLHNFFHPKQPP